MGVHGMVLYKLNRLNLKEEDLKLISVLAVVYYNLLAYGFLDDEVIMNESDSEDNDKRGH